MSGSAIVDSRRAWPLMVTRGALAVIFGVLTVVWPALTVLVFAILFGVYAIVDGIGAVAHAVRRGDRAHRWSYLALGVLGVIAGLVALFWPAITLLVLGIVVGVWALVTGFAEIGAAIRLRRQITGEFFLIIAGLLSVVVGVLVLVYPLVGVFGVAVLVGVYAIIYGVTLLATGFRLRRHYATTASS